MEAVLRVLRAARAGARLAPAAARKPAVLTRWLVEARAAHLALAVLVTFSLLGLPALNDALARLFPAESPNALARMFDRIADRPDPRLEARRRQLAALSWTLGLSSVGALLLASLPPAVERAGAAARSLAQRADAAAGLQSEESLHLYRGALELTVDPAAEAELEAKLREASAARAAGAATLRRAPSEAVPDTELRALRAARTIVAPQRGPAPAGDAVGDRYRVQKELGRGGMGVVYQAHDTVLEREVALKELPPHLCAQTEFARRFRQEARVLARLAHPNIVQVYDLVEDGERLWIALELVQGGTLGDAIRRAGGAIAWPRAVALGRQIAAGLAYAHASGVIHRDVKPINVLLTREEAGVAKLTDFGLAKLAEASVHTQEGTLLGSARYMSPEQASGRPSDARSDAYAFGVTLYELIAGRAPFEGDVAAILAQHVAKPPPPLAQWCPDAPAELEDLMTRLLAKRPEDRPASLEPVVAELAALEAAASGRTAPLGRAPSASGA